MEKEIRNEVKGLIKMGLPENLAIITACANKGKPELAQQYLEELNEEQQEIKDFLNQFKPISEVLELQKEETKIILTEPVVIKCDDVNNEIILTETDLGLTESLSRQ